MKFFLHSGCPPFEKISNNVDFSLWGKQCICPASMRPKLWKSHILLRVPWDEVPSWRVLKCDDEKSYYNETISSQEKKIGSRILRERRAWTLFQQPKSRAMGLDLGSKWAKLQKKKKKGIEEVFKYYSTTRHQHNTSMTKWSKMFCRFYFL